MHLRPNRRFKDGNTTAIGASSKADDAPAAGSCSARCSTQAEINDSRHEAWRKAIEAFDEDARQSNPKIAALPRQLRKSG